MFENIAYMGLGFAAVFFRVRINMALYGLQDSRQINKALFLQTSWLTEIERGPKNNNGNCRKK